MTTAMVPVSPRGSLRPGIRCRAAALVLAALCGLVGGSRRVHAGPGDFDPAFNGSGSAVYHLGASSAAYAVVVQDDGRILVAGTTTGDDQVFRFVLARYLPDGTPDPVFGDRGGYTVSDVGGGDAVGRAVAVLPDGRIIVAGESGTDAFKVALARYTADGRLDPTFGSGNGWVIAGLSSGSDRVHAVTTDESGDIIVGGLASGRRAVARFTPNGELDGAFGQDG